MEDNWNLLNEWPFKGKAQVVREKVTLGRRQAPRIGILTRLCCTGTQTCSMMGQENCDALKDVRQIKIKADGPMGPITFHKTTEPYYRCNLFLLLLTFFIYFLLFQLDTENTFIQFLFLLGRPLIF